jgi:hypothetical protein
MSANNTGKHHHGLQALFAHGTPMQIISKSHTLVAGVLLQLRTVGSFLPREPKCILVWAFQNAQAQFVSLQLAFFRPN